VVQLLLGMEELTQDSQLTPLESGFERRAPALEISSPFFLLAMVFVLFDVELILLIPGIFYQKNILYINFFSWISIIIVIFTTLGLE
jgi:NADH:ubiquinone oxidoreductase subunit 3 (subunit A)